MASRWSIRWATTSSSSSATKARFTATNGPAVGMTSVNVGVSENGTQSGTSIGLVGSGTGL
jgi:hypothetical protein